MGGIESPLGGNPMVLFIRGTPPLGAVGNASRIGGTNGRQFMNHLDVRDRAGDHGEVDRLVPENLIGNI